MRFNGNGIIWDAERNRQLINFGKEKSINIYDEYIIQKLLNIGYKPTEEFIDVEFEEVIKKEVIKNEPKIKLIKNMNIRELKKYCKDKEYKGYTNLDKKQLIKFIKKEGVL